ncbi:MAG: PilZ domain-containing protein [Acidobacteria bacterium]|nr:PilZ domain-containing protein [Acidobacteriota bacterium]
MSGADKRDAERVPILGELHGEVMVFQPILVKDISRTGVTIDTHFPLQIDSLHDVRLVLGERSIVVKGRVAHSHISDVDQDAVVYRTGLEFIEPSLPVTTAIIEFLDSVKAGRRGA